MKIYPSAEDVLFDFFWSQILNNVYLCMLVVVFFLHSCHGIPV